MKILIIIPAKKEIIPVMELLKVLGHHVYLKQYGAEAMYALRHITSDVIVVMDKLKDMTGIEFITRLQCSKCRKKIIYLTNNPNYFEKHITDLMGIGSYSRVLWGIWIYQYLLIVVLRLGIRSR